MAFLNTANLLNIGAEALKTAAAKPIAPEGPTSQTDEFAQALRRQMQQGSKPAASQSMIAEPATVTGAGKPSATAVPTEPGAKQGERTTTSPDQASVTRDKGSADKDKSVSATDDAPPSTEAATIPQETTLDRRKKLLAEQAETDALTIDPLASGIPPWMEGMIAMRPNTEVTAEQPQTLMAGTGLPNAAETALVSPLTDGQVAGTDHAAALPDVTNPASQLPLAGEVRGQAADFKLTLDAQTVAMPPADGGHAETLNMAQALGAAAAESAVAEQAGSRETGGLMQHDATAVTSLPAAQAMPNSPWLNAASVSPTASVMMSQIATPFGNERWQTAMNQHVLNMVGTGDDMASLTLSPPDLGPIQVVLKVDNQSVNTSFITDNPLVRQALEDGLQDLRERMASQGLQLGQAFVGDGQQAQQHFAQQSNRTTGVSSEAGAEVSETAPPAAVRTTVARGLVDTFV